jgi:hypothetical protein
MALEVWIRMLLQVIINGLQKIIFEISGSKTENCWFCWWVCLVTEVFNFPAFFLSNNRSTCTLPYSDFDKLFKKCSESYILGLAIELCAYFRKGIPYIFCGFLGKSICVSKNLKNDPSDKRIFLLLEIGYTWMYKNWEFYPDFVDVNIPQRQNVLKK